MSKQIIAVLGDYYHDEEVVAESLEKALLELKFMFDEKIEMTYVSVGDLIGSLTDQPDLVILFAENRINPSSENIETWMTNDSAEKINDYVEEGGSFIAWHSGLASYDHVENYIDMLRGSFYSHPEENQVVTYKTNSTLKNKTEYEFFDEHYFVNINEELTDVFLTSHSVDGDSIAGWRHEYGKGKVLCIVPAHLKEGLLNESFIQTLTHSLSWCL